MSRQFHRVHDPLCEGALHLVGVSVEAPAMELLELVNKMDYSPPGFEYRCVCIGSQPSKRF